MNDRPSKDEHMDLQGHGVTVIEVLPLARCIVQFDSNTAQLIVPDRYLTPERY